MPITRIYFKNLPTENTLQLDEDNARILRDVLRARPGDEIEILDGAGTILTATLFQLSKKNADVSITKRIGADRLGLSLTLLQGLPKGEKADWIAEKCTELGVHRIIFLQSDRCVPRPTKEKTGRWRKSAVEALRQCGNPFLPEIIGPISVAEALSTVSTDASILFDENHRDVVRPDFLKGVVRSVRMAVGPEGGWSEPERDLFSKAGFQRMSLGPYVLRTETAAVCAIATVRTLLAL